MSLYWTESLTGEEPSLEEKLAKMKFIETNYATALLIYNDNHKIVHKYRKLEIEVKELTDKNIAFNMWFAKRGQRA